MQCSAINTENIFLHHLSLLLYFFPFYLSVYNIQQE